MNIKPKVGLLGLYLDLYDRVSPESRSRMDSFYKQISDELTHRGIDILNSPLCRLRGEVSAAVDKFESNGAEAIVTLHLAYSPSLESAESLAGSRLPVIVLDTTPTYSFDCAQDPAEIMYNHGIHGVQDLCNMLIRLNKRFRVEAGHWEKSDVLTRVSAWIQAAHMANTMRNQRIGRIGEPFRGMGDFQIESRIMHSRVGVESFPADHQLLRTLMPEANDPAVLAEIENDKQIFDASGVDHDAHVITTQVSLAVRRWIERGGLTGFTANFAAFDAAFGLPTVPFLEAEKAMARGIGYAGEGDVLTAALVGTLASTYSETSFTEMFCPDWEGGSVFLSHMGEINPEVCSEKPKLTCSPMPWIEVNAPVMAVGRFKHGCVTLVNLAPGPNGAFTLIVVPGQMLSYEGEDRFANSVRGWFKPDMELTDFLEEYSRLGGTHHSALVYFSFTEDLMRFADIMEWDCAVLGE